MNRSDSINELAAALAIAQGAMEAALMDTKNQFGGVYADLGAVMQAAKGPMSSNGLSVSQHPELIDNKVTVTTILMHASGQWMESSISASIGDNRALSAAQQAGIVITYLRRYAYAAIVGIYADQDTDGAKVDEKKPTPKPQPQPERRPMNMDAVKPLAAPVALSGKPAEITAAKVEQIQAEMAGEPAPAGPSDWDAATIAALARELGIVTNRVKNALNLSNLPFTATLADCQAWMAKYKSFRDQELTPQEAAEKANG